MALDELSYTCVDCGNTVAVVDYETIVKRKKLCTHCLAIDFEAKRSGIPLVGIDKNNLKRNRAVTELKTDGKKTLHKFGCRECAHVTGLLSIVPKMCPKCHSKSVYKIKEIT